MKRSEAMSRLLAEDELWDVVIIGGGATGLGCGLDAVSRGYKTLVLEQADFAKGTSSRSTKLIHGGVRYLRQGNISLVRESLAERGWLMKHLPALVNPQPFLIPTYSFWESCWYRTGLWLYDRLAGKLGIKNSEWLGRSGAMNRVPTLKPDGLAGGILYWDGLFDDARLCIQVARTIASNGGLPLNYVRVERILKRGSRINSIDALDTISGKTVRIRGRAFIQATGVFSDHLRKMDEPSRPPMIRASRGTHLVVDRSFLPNDTAVMVPKTSDGRLLFLVPWLGKVILGTTDVADANICLEPVPTSEEVDFILENAAPYLSKPIGRSNVSSVFTGLRPLVQISDTKDSTASLSRDHVIEVSDSGLITIAGGKWTTFRKMGEDAVAKAIEVGGLEQRPSQSRSMILSGQPSRKLQPQTRFQCYGADAALMEQWIEERPELENLIHAILPYTWAEVLWAIRMEYAQSVEDVLARRTRSLFLDASASMEVAPEVGRFMREELQRSSDWEESSVEYFLQTAKYYRI
jgi:glycerol-3-phosphate dehydrogenase